MVEKSVKIFSIRLEKLQKGIGELKQVVDDMLVDSAKNQFDEAPEYKLKAIQMIIDDIERSVDDMKMVWR